MSSEQKPFALSVVNDEISQDFGRACEVASRQMGVRWIELRSMWDKNIINLDSGEIAEAERLVKKNDLQVIAITGPLFKVDWPGAPQSKAEQRDQFNSSFTFDQQNDVLERSIALAKSFGTKFVRSFDFWRLDDPALYRDAMNERLRQAAERAGSNGITLLLENEHACNTGTAAEAADVLNAVESSYLMLVWDPGNAAQRGETPFPDGYQLLPKNRIAHCHCKDVVRQGKGYAWACVGQGIIDWPGQFRALQRDGYCGAVSLETHWRGAGTAEASSLQSWTGMRAALREAEIL